MGGGRGFERGREGRMRMEEGKNIEKRVKREIVKKKRGKMLYIEEEEKRKGEVWKEKEERKKWMSEV